LNELETILQLLANQEEDLRFRSFTADTALAIGTDIIATAREKAQSIAVDINVHGLQQFHFSMPGTTSENSDWIRRKSNVVIKLGHSSLFLHNYLKSIDKTIDEEYNLPSVNYAAEGGSFPIITSDEGIIGTITVSGLAGEEDHECVVAAIQKYLESTTTDVLS
jgi:uncharacterized protein (UPF0303 family)